MPTPAPIDDVMAMLGVPVAFLLTSLGVGLLIERLLGLRIANALLVPLGMCGTIIVTLAIYWTGAGDVPAVAVIVVLTMAGGLVARDGLLARLNLGWAGLAGLAVYVLFIAPELLSGHWTWSGYNFVNDTATQWLLTEYMKVHGMVATGLLPPKSTATEFVRVYLASAYPLGTHAQLATLSGLLHTQPAVIYQGYIAALAGTAAMGLATLADRLLSPPLAALAALIALGAELTYQYALQGNIKELGALATTTAAIALARHVVSRGIDVRGGLLVAVPLAALLDTYYFAGVPFAGAVAGVALVAALLVSTRRRLWRLARALLVAVVGTCVLAAPALASISTSFSTLSGGFVGGGAPELGQLVRPLPFSEVAGVWLTGDYRLPVVSEPQAKLTAILAGLVFALALAGAVCSLWRRELGPGALLVAMGLVLGIVATRVSPYAAGKVFAIASPAFVLAAFAGGAGLRTLARRWKGRVGRFSQALPLAGVALVVVGVIGSDAYAYHYDNVAPTPRMLAIAQVGDRFAGNGPMLWNEFEEYAKYFADRARVNVPFETLTPRQAQLVVPASIYANYFDLDQEQLAYVESFPIVVTRISPSASRPPANYRLAYINSYYEAWQRGPQPVVLRHLGLQDTFSAAEPVACTALRQLIAGAPSHADLIAAVHPPVVSLAPGATVHPAGWQPDPAHAGALYTHAPGSIKGVIQARQPGRYTVWVQGNLPRAMTVYVDGRRVGAVKGLNTLDQWFDAGEVSLTAGRHTVEVIRPHGDLAPGDGGAAWLGPVSFEQQQPERLDQLPAKAWRSLCGRSLDWVELAAGRT